MENHNDAPKCFTCGHLSLMHDHRGCSGMMAGGTACGCMNDAVKASLPHPDAEDGE